MKFLPIILILFSLLIAGSSPQKPNWPLEVISWDMVKAHPGILYDYRLGIIGGEYPYWFTLVTGPNGLTVNCSTGVILWTPEVTDADTVVDIKIHDVNGDTLRHQFAIDVTTTGFYFIDSASGSDANDGSISSPYETFDKVYKGGSKGDIIYLRAGTYHTDSGWTNWTETNYPNYVELSNSTPCIFIGYPGEDVYYDGEFTADTIPPDYSTIQFWLQQADTVLFQNINFINNGYYTFRSASAKNLIIRNNVFHGVLTSGGENPCVLYAALTNPDTVDSFTQPRYVLQDNEIKDMNTQGRGAGVVLFSTFKVLMEDNNIHDLVANAINDKSFGYYNTYRNNLVHDITGYGIWMGGQGSQKQLDIHHNTVYNTSSEAVYMTYQSGWTQNEYVHHNTLTRPIVIRYHITDPLSGYFNIFNNIISSVGWGGGVQFERDSVYDTARVDNKLDSDNNLFYTYHNSQPVAMSIGYKSLGYGDMKSLSTIQADGFDSNSIFTNPNLDVNYKVSPSSEYYGVYGADRDYRTIPDLGWDSSGLIANYNNYSLSGGTYSKKVRNRHSDSIIAMCNAGDSGDTLRLGPGEEGTLTLAGIIVGVVRVIFKTFISGL